MQVLALASIKLSILFFYRRIFRGHFFGIAIWVLIGLVVAWASTFFIAILAACGTHIRANFQTLAALKSECVDTFRILIALSASDVAVDLAILVVPIPLVSMISAYIIYDNSNAYIQVLSLQMPVRRKLAVLAILLVGVLLVSSTQMKVRKAAESDTEQLLVAPLV